MSLPKQKIMLSSGKYVSVNGILADDSQEDKESGFELRNTAGTEESKED